MSTVVQPRGDQSAHKRRVNDLIHESLHEHLQSETIGFFCECSSSRCFEPVWLTVEDYDTGRRDPSWSVRAAGHY
jgi:redox-regulated HSP33 family molecular chaperone